MKIATNALFMETMSIPKLLARFAGPALIGMLAHALYNIVDRIFVGHVVGPSGIGALALSFPCMMLFFSFAQLIGVGAASRISLLLGEKKQKRAEQTLGNAFMMAVVVSIVLWVLASFFFEDILLLSGATETLMPQATDYLSIILWGTLPSTLGYALSCQIRAAGRPTYAMGSEIIGAISNIALDALFVITLGMGVRGAAIATVISMVISMFWALAFFLRPTAPLRLRLMHILRPNKTSLLRIIAVGTPQCFVHLNLVMVHGMITNASSRFGGDLGVSATGIVMGLDSLIFMPAIAIADACMPIIGYNYGAGKPLRAAETVKIGVLACTSFYILSWSVIMLWAEHLAKIFNSSDQELIRMTASILRVANIVLPLMGVTLVFTSLLQGLGRGREGLFFSFMRLGVFLWIPLLILPNYFGVHGAWAAFPVSDLLGSIICGFYMVKIIKTLKNSAEV